MIRIYLSICLCLGEVEAVHRGRVGVYHGDGRPSRELVPTKSVRTRPGPKHGGSVILIQKLSIYIDGICTQF